MLIKMTGLLVKTNIISLSLSIMQNKNTDKIIIPTESGFRNFAFFTLNFELSN